MAKHFVISLIVAVVLAQFAGKNLVKKSLTPDIITSSTSILKAKKVRILIFCFRVGR